MNINPDSLQRAYELALTSGKVEPKRLARAMELVPGVIKTFTGVYTDKSRIEEYFVPGSAHTGYSITVRDRHNVSSCTCKDYQQRQVAYCKHRLAVMLIVRAESLVPGSVTANVVTVAVTDASYRRQQLDKMFGPD